MTVPLEVLVGSGHPRTVRINQRDVGKSGVLSAGQFELPANTSVKVILSTKGAGGVVHADAIGWDGGGLNLPVIVKERSLVKARIVHTLRLTLLALLAMLLPSPHGSLH